MGAYDVIVCGAGPAGIGAAVQAGRMGARTLLVERLGYVSGMAAIMGSFCDSPGGPVFDDLAQRLIAYGWAHWNENPDRYRPPGRLGYRPEMLKAVAMEMLVEAGVEVLLDSFVEGPVMEDGAVAGVWLANKAGRSQARSAVVVDCTADGDVAAGAGARIMKGDPEDGRMQHVNFGVRLTGIDEERWQRERPDQDELLRILGEAHQSGELLCPPGLFRVPPPTFPLDPLTGELSLGRWEIQGVDASDPVATSRCLVDCTVAALRLVRFCRKRLPGFEKVEIQRIPLSLGTRESRRILGGYVLTGEDVVVGAKFDDGVVQAWFWLDLHDPEPGLSTPYSLDYVKANQPPPGDWFEVPYRCLVPEDVEGLLVAGRCISCDRPAQGAIRIMTTCMFLGAAAGAAGALAAEQGLPVRDLPPQDIRGVVWPA